MRGVDHNLIPESELPAARLELRWRRTDPDEDGYDLRCDYSIVIPLGEHDIRGETEDHQPRLTELKRDLGGTRTSGKYWEGDRSIRTPFRDHVHIRWDSMATGLPAFVVADGWAQRILPAEDEQ